VKTPTKVAPIGGDNVMENEEGQRHAFAWQMGELGALAYYECGHPRLKRKPDLSVFVMYV